MKAPFLARKTHKWIALVIGIQVTFWMLSGAYMAVLDIDFIHGDPLVKNIDEPFLGNVEDLYLIKSIVNRYPRATQIDLVSRIGVPYYVVIEDSAEPVLLYATSGVPVSPIPVELVAELARYYYAGDGALSDVNLLRDDSDRPSEIQARPLPLWQVRFDDAIQTTFYISPSTGELVSRRHTFWRVYDFLWMFHIMDYESRTDLNNNLLRVASFFGISFGLTGVWLLVYALKRKRPVAGPINAADEGSKVRHDLVPKIS
ncbi:MAG TPA: hypothetical protein PKK10_00880 [Woeseiaceae bacterium]|nr:hypothetical protein [Woeseiaceae bacterium]